MKQLLVISLALIPSLFAQQAVSLSQQEVESIVQQFETSYMDAYSHGDAKALAALYTDNATVLGEYGAVLQGRAKLEKAFSASLAAHAKIEDTPKASTAVTGDVIVTQGVSRRIVESGSQPERSFLYTKVLVRQAGGWRLAAIQYSPAAVIPKMH